MKPISNVKLTLGIATALAGLSGGINGQEDVQTPASAYHPSIFAKRLTAEQHAFLTGFAGLPSGDPYEDKQFRKLRKGFVPGCLFHYGRNMPLTDALSMVLDHSPGPVLAS